MAAAAPLRQDVAPYLDDTWGLGELTEQGLYNITSEVRQPMAFEEEAWDKPRHQYTWEQVKAMERNEFDHRLDLHSIYGPLVQLARAGPLKLPPPWSPCSPPVR